MTGHKLRLRGRFIIAMQIRLLNETEYELSKSLWLECFPEDGEEFVDWYYSDRSRPEYVLGAFAEGEDTPVSMLHMIPVDMRFMRRTEKVCLVSGVSTKSTLRRRGLCSALFDRAFPIMRERGFAATVLQPFDPRFYERYGYRTFILRRRAELAAESVVRPSETVGRPYGERIAPDPDMLFKLYSHSMLGFSGCTVRSPEYFRGFIKEYSMDGARLEVTRYGCCAGYAAGGEFHATELFFTSNEALPYLLPGGFARYSFPLPADHVPPRGSGGAIEEFSMIKLLSPDFRMGPGPMYGFDRY